MTREEQRRVIANVRECQIEPVNVEVKAARGATLRRLYEWLSAFSIRTGSAGMIVRL